jgi:hypothetical protein
LVSNSPALRVADEFVSWISPQPFTVTLDVMVGRSAVRSARQNAADPGTGGGFEARGAGFQLAEVGFGGAKVGNAPTDLAEPLVDEFGDVFARRAASEL